MIINPDTIIHQIPKPAPIEVGEQRQCLANGKLIDLPDKVDRSIAEGVFEFLFQAARYGIGEGTQAKGMIAVITGYAFAIYLSAQTPPWHRSSIEV